MIVKLPISTRAGMFRVSKPDAFGLEVVVSFKTHAGAVAHARKHNGVVLGQIAPKSGVAKGFRKA